MFLITQNKQKLKQTITHPLPAFSVAPLFLMLKEHLSPSNLHTQWHQNHSICLRNKENIGKCSMISKFTLVMGGSTLCQIRGEIKMSIEERQEISECSLQLVWCHVRYLLVNIWIFYFYFFVLWTQFYVNKVLIFPCECFMCATFKILILIVNFVTHDKQPPNKDLCLIRCLVLTLLNSFPLSLTSPPNVKGPCIWVMFGWLIKSISI
jgi:hypothetical protein